MHCFPGWCQLSTERILDGRQRGDELVLSSGSRHGRDKRGTVSGEWGENSRLHITPPMIKTATTAAASQYY